jgi:uncharacterized DUF497 family protein
MKRKRNPRSDEVDWDEAKNDYNKRNHEGISFEEAQSVFNDPLAKTVDDLDHSYDERRYFTTGYSTENKLLVLWHTYPEAGYRLIGARKANKRETRNYEKRERE